MTFLVGLGGYAFAGKDTVADTLERDHGWSKTFMSKPLRDALLALNPLIPILQTVEDGPDGIQRWNRRGRPTVDADRTGVAHVRYRELFVAVGYDESKRNPEVRDLLQRLGTEVGRAMFGETVWADLVFAEVSRLRAAGRDVAVTGIRFGNELDALRAAGGVPVWVDRPGFGPVNGHVSDNLLAASDFDVTVRNDGSCADLAVKVDGLVADLHGRRAA